MQGLLEKIIGGRGLLALREGATLFSQGEEADEIYFVQTGTVQLSVVSGKGRTAIVGTRGPRDFLGEECLVNDTRRTTTATSLGSAAVFGIAKGPMLAALHGQPQLSERFMASLLARNVSLGEDLCNQLFNHNEKGLACVLLRLSGFGRGNKHPDTTVVKFTHQMLAEMVGTDQPRISFLMNKFRKLGLIDYEQGKADILVRGEALTASILNDALFAGTQDELTV